MNNSLYATASPWEVYDPEENGDIEGIPNGYSIRSLTDKDSDWIATGIHRRADADMMAAVPDLLAIAKWALSDLENVAPKHENHSMHITIRQLKAYIARAEGRTQ